MTPRVRIIGCGTFGNGDDQVGLEVAKRIRAVREDWDVVLDTGGGSNALDWAEGADLLVLVDACHAGNGLDLGQMLRIDYIRHPDVLEQCPFLSSHAMSIATGLKLLATLDRLPEHVEVYGVGARAFDPLKPFSPPVIAAVPELADRIIENVNLFLDSSPCTNSA